MKTIFDETRLGNLSVKNRIVRSATWEDMASDDGSMTPELLDLYEDLAKGGVGTIITGFTSVDQNDRYFGGMMRLGKDELVSEYIQLVNRIHAHGAKVIAQLALGGYFTADATEPIEQNEMTTQEIRHVITLFADAARRAEAAGFDGVQIHAAHFFFLSRFISPAVNHRTDEYGGSTEGRSRILVEILQAIHSAAPRLHITIKLNASDMTHGGLDVQESLVIAKRMEKAGLDSIEISANGTSVSGIRAGQNEGYFLPYGKLFAEELNIPVILVGGHRSIESMDTILNDSKIEFLSISRPLVREPDLVKRWQAGDTAPAKCVSCNSCYRTPCHQCIFNLRKG